MNTADRLDRLLSNPPFTLAIPCPSVFFSDLHMGDGGLADDFKPNYRLFMKVYQDYVRRGFTAFFLGDLKDLWQFNDEEIRKAYGDPFGNKPFFIKGNHDAELDLPEAIVLTGYKTPVLLVHGHQGDWINDNRWGISRWFVKYVWKTLEYVGICEDWFSARFNPKRHDKVRKALIEWANDRKVTLLCGHIHTQENEGFYWNIGCETHTRQIECIEYDGEFILKSWT